MAKTRTQGTLNPRHLAPAVGVFYEDARAVEEQLNWSAGLRPVVHVSMVVGDDNWAGGSELQTLRLVFPTSSGWAARLYFKIKVKPETQNITVGAMVYMSAAQEGQVRWTVGAAAASTLTTFTNGTNGTEHTATVATSSSGTGAIDVQMEINHTTGSAADCFVRNVRVEDQTIAAADLADPADT